MNDYESDERRLLIEGNRLYFAFGVVALLFVIGAVAVLIFQTEQRNDAIDELRTATARIEQAATHTEEVLVEVVEERNTPEAIAQSQAVRQALADIRDIKQMLCSVPEIAESGETTCS